MLDEATLRRKALAVLREGRLTVVVARSRTAEGVLEPHEVVARVRSSRQGGPAYAVDLCDDVWSCTCRAAGLCGHVVAAQLVTGRWAA